VRFLPLIFRLLLLVGFVAALGNLTAEELTIVVIPRNGGDKPENAIRKGAEQAVVDFESSGCKIKLDWQASQNEEEAEGQRQSLSRALARDPKVDGIILEAADPTVLTAELEAARDAEVPVIALNTRLDSTLTTASLTTSEAESGRVAAEYMGELLKGKGNVMVLRNTQDSDVCEQREQGFIEGLRTNFPRINIISNSPCVGPTAATAYVGTQAILKFYSKDVNGLFTSAGPITEGANVALNEAQLAGGKVVHIGCDTSDLLYDAMRAGDLQGLVAKDGFELGRRSVKVLVEFIHGHSPALQVGVPGKLITTPPKASTAQPDVLPGVENAPSSLPPVNPPESIPAPTP